MLIISSVIHTKCIYFFLIDRQIELMYCRQPNPTLTLMQHAMFGEITKPIDEIEEFLSAEIDIIGSKALHTQGRKVLPTTSSTYSSSRPVLNRNNTSLVLLANRICLAVELLVSRSRRLLRLILVLKQESELLQRPARSLGPQEVDDDDLEAQEADVRQQVLPLGVLQTDRVDKGVEETGAAAEELEEGDAACAGSEGVKFDQKGVSERVVAHIVAGRVGEHPEDDEVADSSLPVSEELLLSNCPARIHALTVVRMAAQASSMVHGAYWILFLFWNSFETSWGMKDDLRGERSCKPGTSFFA